MDLVFRGRGDAGENLIGFVVAGLDSLEIQDGETAQAGQLAGEASVDDRVHRGGEDRDRKGNTAHVDGQVNVGGLYCARAGRERDVLKAVGRANRIDLRVE